jgi:hypothetical protein
VSDVTLPPWGYATLSPDSGRYLVVTGLKHPVPKPQPESPAPGESPADLILTFTFSGGNDRTVKDVEVNVAPPASPLPRTSLSFEPEG